MPRLLQQAVVLLLSALALPATALAAEEASAGHGLTPPVLLQPPPSALSIEPHLRRDQLLAAGAVTLVATPAAFALAATIGKASNDLYGAAIPALLVGLLLPPAAAAATSWAVGRESERVKPGPWVAFLAAFASHAACSTVGALLGVSIDKPGPLMLLLLIDTLATTAATVFTMDAAADAKPLPPPTAAARVAFHAKPGDPPLPPPLAMLPLFHADF